jgi:hypothetical protein
VRYVRKEVSTKFRITKRIENNVPGYIFFQMETIKAIPEEDLPINSVFARSVPFAEDPGWTVDQIVDWRILVQVNCDRRSGFMDHDLDRFLEAHPETMAGSEGDPERVLTREGEFIVETTTHTFIVCTEDGLNHRFDKDGKFVSSTRE